MSSKEISQSLIVGGITLGIVFISSIATSKHLKDPKYSKDYIENIKRKIKTATDLSTHAGQNTNLLFSLLDFTAAREHLDEIVLYNNISVLSKIVGIDILQLRNSIETDRIYLLQRLYQQSPDLFPKGKYITFYNWK